MSRPSHRSSGVIQSAVNTHLRRTGGAGPFLTARFHSGGKRVPALENAGRLAQHRAVPRRQRPGNDFACSRVEDNRGDAADGARRDRPLAGAADGRYAAGASRQPQPPAASTPPSATRPAASPLDEWESAHHPRSRQLSNPSPTVHSAMRLAAGDPAAAADLDAPDGAPSQRCGRTAHNASGGASRGSAQRPCLLQTRPSRHHLRRGGIPPARASVGRGAGNAASRGRRRPRPPATCNSVRLPALPPN